MHKYNGRSNRRKQPPPPPSYSELYDSPQSRGGYGIYRRMDNIPYYRENLPTFIPRSDTIPMNESYPVKPITKTYEITSQITKITTLIILSLIFKLNILLTILLEQSKTNLYVTNFPKEWTSEKLKSLFSIYGNIKELRIMAPNEEKNVGVGFVHFEKETDATNAINSLNSTSPDGIKGRLIIRGANINSTNNDSFFNKMRIDISRIDIQKISVKSAVNLYVSNLPSETTEKSIRELFSKFGNVSKINLPSSAPNKGKVAFVHYSNPDDATKAMAKLNDTNQENVQENLSVRYANVNKPNYPKWFNNSHYKNMQVTSNVYVTHLPLEWKEDKVCSMFKKFGEVKEVRLLKNNDKSGGVAFIHFVDEISACRAIVEMNNTVPEGAKNCIFVQYAKVHPRMLEKVQMIEEDKRFNIDRRNIKRTYYEMDRRGYGDEMMGYGNIRSIDNNVGGYYRF